VTLRSLAKIFEILKTSTERFTGKSEWMRAYPRVVVISLVRNVRNGMLTVFVATCDHVRKLKISGGHPHGHHALLVEMQFAKVEVIQQFLRKTETN